MATEPITDISTTCFGRKVIYTTYTKITKENVVQAVRQAAELFQVNKSEIQFLQNYFKGDQPILQRVKTIRPEVCNKVQDNWAKLIIAFKDGYLLGDPIQYVTKKSCSKKNEKENKPLDNDNERAEKESLAKTKDVERLNDIVDEADKAAHDEVMCHNSHICGTSYRMILAQENPEDGILKIIDAEPERTFVVYSSEIGHDPVFAVYETEVPNADGTRGMVRYNCYTKDKFFIIDDGVEAVEKDNALGFIPIIEYPNNAERIGEFEVVLSLLNLINLINSNRMDGVEQFVQSYLKIINADITKDDFEAFRTLGAIKIKDNIAGVHSDVDYITQELNQTQTEVLIASIKADILAITGIPNRNGGSSTSDTGTAVIMRDGWSDAETRAKSRETIIKKSEKNFLKCAIKIINDCKISNGGKIDLKPSDVDIKFTRRNYENITQKSTVLTQLLGSDKVHPRYAFEYCGLFKDPETAYLDSKRYVEMNAKKLMDTKVKENIEGGDSNGGDKNSGTPEPKLDDKK